MAAPRSTGRPYAICSSPPSIPESSYGATRSPPPDPWTTAGMSRPSRRATDLGRSAGRADGTWSKVRPLLSDAKPEYCGISYLELHLSDVDERHPDSAALVGPGIFFALADNKALMAHGGRHIHLGASLRVPQAWTVKTGVDWSAAAAARDILLKEFADWSVD